MPSCYYYLNNFLRKPDLFCHGSFVRYNGQAEYSTATGGFLSLAVITIFIALFFTEGLSTIKKEIVTSSVQTESEIDPSSYSFTIGPEGDIMFGFWIKGLDLNANTSRLFDVVLTEQKGFRSRNTTDIVLQQCTLTDMNFNDALSQLSGRFPIQNGLCPQRNQRMTVAGSFSSDVYTTLKVELTRCNSTADVTCANDATFATEAALFGSFQLIFAVIHANINPGSQDYKTYFIDMQKTLVFDTSLGVTG